MTNEATAPDTGRARYRVRLPGFVTNEPVGLGDVVKRATSLAGVAPCSGCAQRVRALNRWVSFTGRNAQSR
jgi:hypothetical protein